MIINEDSEVCQVLLATLKAYWPSKNYKNYYRIFIPSKVFNSLMEKYFKLSILTPDKDLALEQKLLLNSDFVSVTKK